jgi:RNA polymerase sigma-70 factor (ECF subfamily)
MAASSQNEFAKCFLRWQGRLYAYITTLLPNRSDAEEVFQQTSLILWLKWDQYDPDRNFLAWACGMAHFEVRNFLRQRKPDQYRVVLSDEVLDLLASTRLAMEEGSEERIQALRICLDSLPNGQGRLIEEHYEHPDSATTVAKRLGITRANFYMRLHRIRRILMDCIDKRLAAEGSL